MGLPIFLLTHISGNSKNRFWRQAPTPINLLPKFCSILVNKCRYGLLPTLPVIWRGQFCLVPLPPILYLALVVRGGIEPSTRGFSVLCYYLAELPNHIKFGGPYRIRTDLISSLQGRRPPQAVPWPILHFRAYSKIFYKLRIHLLIATA